MTDMFIVAGLVVLGLVLITLEVLVIPGFGVVGILGILAILGAGVMTYMRLGTQAGIVAFVLAGVLLVLMLWLLPKTRSAKKMVLQAKVEGRAANQALAELLGKEGKARTGLRPSGVADFDDRPYDVVTDGEFVEAGTKVRVVKVEGMRVIVEPIA